MGAAACARCGKQVREDALLYSDVGRVCGSCEQELGDAERDASARWALAASGPLLAFSSLVTLLAGFFPVIGVFVLALSPLLAILALATGARAFLVSHEADGPERLLLVLGGGVGALGGGVLLAASLLALVSMLLAIAGRGF